MPLPTVLSVPAGKSYAIIQKHHIYSCPAAYVYKTTQMISFRTAPPESKMERVFTVLQIEVADPADIEGTCKAAPSVRERIAAYVSDAKAVAVLAKPGKYRFYVLAPDTAVPLSHAPVPREASKGPLYFSLAELQSGKAAVDPLPHLTYQEKLLDERWIATRDRIQAQRNGKCERYGIPTDLEVHHGYYSPFLEPWE